MAMVQAEGHEAIVGILDSNLSLLQPLRRDGTMHPLPCHIAIERRTARASEADIPPGPAASLL